MSKKRLIILLISLLFIFSIVSSADAILWVGNTPDYYWQYHYFNGTIVDKDVYLSHQGEPYYNYLIDVDGTTFFLHGWYYGHHEYVGNFNVGDKVTIYGNTIKEERNMHSMDSFDFNGKYSGTIYTSSKKFPEMWIGNEKLRLADESIGSQRSSTTPTVTTNNYLISMNILKATITTGSHKEDKTLCTVFVGKGYSGEPVHISVLYSRDGKKLNEGNIVPKNVTNSGEITVSSLKAFEKYPDKAKITIYDNEKNKLDTQTVTLEKNSGSQIFKFFDDPEYALNGAKFVGYAGDGTWANYYKDGHYYTVDGEQID